MDATARPQPPRAPVAFKAPPPQAPVVAKATPVAPPVPPPPPDMAMVQAQVHRLDQWIDYHERRFGYRWVCSLPRCWCAAGPWDGKLASPRSVTLRGRSIDGQSSATDRQVTGLEVRLAEGLQACHPKAPQHPSTSKGKQLLDEIENRHNQLLNMLVPLNARVDRYALWSLVYLKAVWGEFSGAAIWF